MEAADHKKISGHHTAQPLLERLCKAVEHRFRIRFLLRVGEMESSGFAHQVYT